MKVFLSHSSTDKDFVRKLKSDLQSAGVGTWFDEDDISFGDSLVDRINVGLNSCDHAILVISDHFLKSKWAGWESESAIANAIAVNSKVIPVLIEDVWNNVSPLLYGKLYADFREHKNLVKYQERLNKLIVQLLGTTLQAKTPSSPVILVTGTKDLTFKTPAFEIAYKLGQQLGASKLQLMTGVSEGVDEEFARGASDTLITMQTDIRKFLTCYCDKGKQPRHKYGKILSSRFSYREEGIPELISDSDIAVLIGGGKHTNYLGMVAMLENKIVLPVASAGGASVDLYSIALVKFEKLFGNTFDKNLFTDLADQSLSPTQMAETCVQLIEYIRHL